MNVWVTVKAHIISFINIWIQWIMLILIFKNKQSILENGLWHDQWQLVYIYIIFTPGLVSRVFDGSHIRI
jgi:hypothetical protein